MGNYLKITQDQMGLIHFGPDMEEFINSFDDDEMFEYAFETYAGREYLETMTFKEAQRPNYAAIAMSQINNPSDKEITALVKFFKHDSASTKGMSKEEIRVLRKVFYKMEFQKIKMTTSAQEDASWEALFGKE